MSTAGHLACLLVLQSIKFHQKQLTIPPSHFLKLTELNLQLPQIYTLIASICVLKTPPDLDGRMHLCEFNY